MIICQLFFTCF